ncbi:hypothetical protein [Pseudoalteromonas aurantia]|nr:hypothetical protein [Pseudoalteromonas aurantia]
MSRIGQTLYYIHSPSIKNNTKALEQVWSNNWQLLFDDQEAVNKIREYR